MVLGWKRTRRNLPKRKTKKKEFVYDWNLIISIEFKWY